MYNKSYKSISGKYKWYNKHILLGTLNLEVLIIEREHGQLYYLHIGDVTRLTTSTYVAIQDRIQNVSPDSDGTKWQLVAQGDSAYYLSTRGDLLNKVLSIRSIKYR